MKHNRLTRVLCLALILVVVLPSMAMADKISGVVTAYRSKDTSTALEVSTSVSAIADYTNENGWYYVPYKPLGQAPAGAPSHVYVRKSDVKVIEGEQEEETPVITKEPTLAPGQTATPKPTATAGNLTGNKDASYQGEVLSYTVPAQGLTVYNTPSTASPVDALKANTKVQLSTAFDDAGAVVSGWYAIFSGSNTYYVPKTSITAAAIAATPIPSTVNSGELVADDTQIASEITTLRAQLAAETNVVKQRQLQAKIDALVAAQSNLNSSITAGGIPYYDKFKVVTGTTYYVVDGTRIGYLQTGNRVNIKFHRDGVYTFNDGTGNYYISASYINTGSLSSASVVGNADASFVTRITIPAAPVVSPPVATASLNLYTSASNTANYIALTNATGAISLYAEKVDDDWYRVTYSNQYYYVKIADVVAASAAVSQVVANDTVATATFYVTIAHKGLDANGAVIPVYAYRMNNKPKKEDNNPDTSSPLTIGGNYLVSAATGNWYAYTRPSGDILYIHKTDVATSTSSTQMSSYNVTLDPTTTNLYDKKGATSPSSKKLPGTATTTYAVQVVDESYFSISLDGTTYYIKRSELAAGTAMEKIATTTTGNTYTVVIGTPTYAYTDSGLTTTSLLYFPAGTSVRVKKINSVLYMVSQGDANYYIPASCVIAVSGGDDGTGDQSNPSSGNVSEIMQGETTNGQTVLTYQITANGLMLYTSTTATNPAVVLGQGKTVQLNEPNPAIAGWYTTWYGNQQYYVKKSHLTTNETDLKTTGTYSAEVMQNTTLYTKQKIVTDRVPYTAANGRTLYYNNRRVELSEAVGTSLAIGERINVKVHAYLYVNGVVTTTPSVYSVQIDTKTYYFYAEQGSARTLTDVMTATAGNNTDTKMIRKFTMDGWADLYAYPDSASSSVLPDAGEVVYGTRYNDDWYQVIYNSDVWYLDAYMAVSSTGGELLSISNQASDAGYTVVIGSKGATLYKSTALKIGTKDNFVETSPGSGTAVTLPGGSVVVASKVNASWYSYYHLTHGTVYFQNNVVANASTNNSISSFVIKIPVGASIPVYSSIATGGVALANPLTAGSSYTMRYIDDRWCSVFVDGGTYYVKRADLLSQAAQELYDSIPVASTTVGKTYTITLTADSATDKIWLYPDNTLSGTGRGPIPSGYTTKGTKMYAAAVPPATVGTLSYQVTYNGTSGYVDAKYVKGVQSGDEADEAKKAAEEAAAEAEKNALYVNLPSGTLLYPSQSTSGTPSVLPSTSTLKLTRINSEWYSVEFLGQTYYIPASTVSQYNTGVGTNTAVGETIMHTFGTAVTAYVSPDSDAAVATTILPNQLLRLKKVSDGWFELDQGTTKVYIKVSDVNGNSPNSGSAGDNTTDGTGIITSQIKIVATSGTVNLRKQPRVGSTIMERIPIGTVVNNLGYEKDSSGQLWYKTTYKGITGYVVGTYVEAVGSGGTNYVDPSADVGRTLTVESGTVNVRSGPGTNYTIIGRVIKGDKIVPTGYKEGTDGMIWYSYNYSASKTAYIRYDYLTGGVAGTMELSGNVAIKAGDTNLRSGAGAGFGVITKLARDSIVTIVGTGTDSNDVLWYNITQGSLKGYVRHDMVRMLTTAESSGLSGTIINSYSELKYGSTGSSVLALQNQLIKIGYLASGLADGTYGVQTTDAVTRFQRANGLSATGVATAATQAAIYNAMSVSTGSTSTLNWFTDGGEALLKAYPNITVYDFNAKVSWNAKYINGANHADVVPASTADAQKLVANNITGSYVRRPVMVTINGKNYAGSMYAVGHGSTSYVSYFSGVMCIHFTGSKTHGSSNVDADHQAAIDSALQQAQGMGY